MSSKPEITAEMVNNPQHAGWDAYFDHVDEHKDAMAVIKGAAYWCALEAPDDQDSLWVATRLAGLRVTIDFLKQLGQEDDPAGEAVRMAIAVLEAAKAGLEDVQD